MGQRIACGTQSQIPLRGDVDDALVPTVGLPDRLMHRQCVNELVGDDDVGAGGYVGERRVPKHRHIQRLEPAPLLLFQSWTDLDQMQDNRGLKVFGDFSCAQRVDDQRAVPGPKLDDAHIFRRAHLSPDGDHPHADQLAEHLADLGRGDEIAGGADRIVRDVVTVLRMGQREPHVVGERHRPGDGDQSADFTFQRRVFISHFGRSAGGPRLPRAQPSLPGSAEWRAASPW